MLLNYANVLCLMKYDATLVVSYFNTFNWLIKLIWHLFHLSVEIESCK